MLKLHGFASYENSYHREYFLQSNLSTEMLLLLMVRLEKKNKKKRFFRELPFLPERRYIICLLSAGPLYQFMEKSLHYLFQRNRKNI